MILRSARADDAAALAAVYAPYVRDTVISFEETPPDAAEMGRRLAQVQAAHAWLVCADGDAVLGYAYTSAHHARAAYRWSVDVAVYVHAAAHRRGVGRALYGALLPLAAAQGYATAHAGITLPNAASVALHERLGFTPVGIYRAVGFKRGAWHDVGWWSRPLAPRPTPPPEPRPPTAADWATALAAGTALLHRG